MVERTGYRPVPTASIAALGRSTATSCAYLNSDDILLPGTLAYVAKAFRDNPDVDLVYGHRIYIDLDGLEIGRCAAPVHDPQALEWADYVPLGDAVLAATRMAGGRSHR